MSTDENNTMRELEDMRNDYLNKKALLSEQTITNDEQIKACIHSGISGLKTAERKLFLITVSCILLLSIVMLYNKLELMTAALKYSTMAVVALYVATLLASRSGRLEELYEKDMNSFIAEVKRQRKVQYRMIRVYIIAFFIWASFMVALPLASLQSVSEKLALMAVLLPVILVNVVATLTFHNYITGSYDDLVLVTEKPETAEVLNKYERMSNNQRITLAKRKFTLCIVMIVLEAIGLIWEGVRVINGKGILATLSIYAVFLILFIVLARVNRKEMDKYNQSSDSLAQRTEWPSAPQK